MAYYYTLTYDHHHLQDEGTNVGRTVIITRASPRSSVGVVARIVMLGYDLSTNSSMELLTGVVYLHSVHHTVAQKLLKIQIQKEKKTT